MWLLSCIKNNKIDFVAFIEYKIVGFFLVAVLRQEESIMTRNSAVSGAPAIGLRNVGTWFFNRMKDGTPLYAHQIKGRQMVEASSRPPSVHVEYHANCGAIGLEHGEPPTVFCETPEEVHKQGAVLCPTCTVGRDKPKNGSGAAQQACDLLVYKGLRCPECGCDTVMAIDIRAKFPSAPFQWVCVCDRNDHDCYYREVTDRLPSSLVAQ